MYKFEYDGQKYLSTYLRFTKTGMEAINVRIYNEAENQYRFHADKLTAYAQQIKNIEFVKRHKKGE